MENLGDNYPNHSTSLIWQEYVRINFILLMDVDIKVLINLFENTSSIGKKYGILSALIFAKNRYVVERKIMSIQITESDLIKISKMHKEFVEINKSFIEKLYSPLITICPNWPIE